MPVIRKPSPEFSRFFSTWGCSSRHRSTRPWHPNRTTSLPARRASAIRTGALVYDSGIVRQRQFAARWCTGRPTRASAEERIVIVTDLDVSKEAFEAGTGWEIKPEGACKGEVCVPLDQSGGFDLRSTTDRLRMAVVHDADEGLWAIGPESLGDRALVTADAPELVLPDLDGNEFRLSTLARAEGRDRLVGALLRLPLRPVRVAGAAFRAPPQGSRGRHGRDRDQRRRGVPRVHRARPSRSTRRSSTRRTRWKRASASSTSRTSSGSTRTG